MAHIPTFFQRPDRIREPLYVLTSVFNSARYRSRWKLYEDFARRCEDVGAILYTAEVAFGAREWAVTDATNPRHLQLRTSSELWMKEKALNLLAQRLPHECQYIAWIDADVRFARDDWANETIHQLQHFSVVQMFSQSLHLSNDNEIISTSGGFAASHLQGQPTIVSGDKGEYPYYGDFKAAALSKDKALPYPHPGYAWAMRREAWDALGGLLDFAILGGADWHMAHAFLGQVEHTLKGGYGARFEALMKEWQARADRSIRRNLGIVSGLVIHHWHGPKASRGYQGRHQILKETGFDPDVDLKPDRQGLWQLTGRSTELRDRIREYMRLRNEDALS